MRGNEVREKYLKFFEARGHKIIAPAPLVLEDDPTTLFTSSGMQPLVSYLMGKPHSEGKRLVNSQPSLRVGDIEEVGDNRHTTFFEMLGNWSLGDYFKKEQIAWFWEFLTKELNLPPQKLYVSVFEGEGKVAKDEESAQIWKSLGVAEDHIFYYGVKKNWWSRSGTPSQMPVGEIGGPDSEVFFEFESIKHDPKYGEKCHPNCDCGRFLEIGNSVFMEYEKTKNGLVELPNKNVDFGGGLERLTAAANNDPDIFKTDLFWPLIKKIEEVSGKAYEGYESDMRVIADHLKASVFLIAGGVSPSNKLQGYILRRLLRRAATKAFHMDRNFGNPDHFQGMVEEIITIYHDFYLKRVDQKKIVEVIINEILKFRKTLGSGLRKIDQIFQNRNDINGQQAFELYSTYGFPIELLIEEASKLGKTVDTKAFNEEMEKHQELSREASAALFKIE